MPTNQPSVLVVDDEQLNWFVIEGLLEDLTTMVTWASDGYKAITHLAEHHVDIVFMDGHMPGMDGTETTSKLLVTNPDLKIIAVSANESFRAPMLEAGCIDFLSKPVDPETLLDAVSKALKLSVVAV